MNTPPSREDRSRSLFGPNDKLERPAPPEFEDPNAVPAEDALVQIGYMTVVTAGVEDTLHALYWNFAKMSDKLGRIITGDLKPNRLCGDIVKLAESSRKSNAIVTDLKSLFRDLDILTKYRNRCVHWIWDNSSKTGHKLYAPAYHKEEGVLLTVSTDDLKLIARELAWIEIRISMHNMLPKALKKERTKHGALRDVYAPAPWLNTPAQLKPKGAQDRRRDKKKT